MAIAAIAKGRKLQGSKAFMFITDIWSFGPLKKVLTFIVTAINMEQLSRGTFSTATSRHNRYTMGQKNQKGGSLIPTLLRKSFPKGL